MIVHARLLLAFTFAVSMVALEAGAQGGPPFAPENARTYAGGLSKPLTAPSNAAPQAIVAQFLNARGRNVDVRSLVARDSSSARNGIRVVSIEQRVQGLRVYGTYAKASLTSRGELIHLIENLARPSVGARREPRISEAQALVAALRYLFPNQTIEIGAGRRDGDTVIFERTAFFHAEPTVTHVAFPTTGEATAFGLLVETWSERGNLLHETLIGLNGEILFGELRTNFDSYNIFPENPDATGQTVVAGPGAGNDESPAGWLFAGSQTTADITGNNAHAYLDGDANNRSDGGGTVVNDGNFLSAADLTAAPTEAVNKNVAVQSIFYFNNVIHDGLYAAGFTEAAGNFQENNFGLGGRGSDSVNAEAQDGSGTDNANFATPRDGQNPRMQMFLWSGKGDHQVVVGSTTYRAQGAEFGPPLDVTGVTGVIQLVNDGAGVSATDACEAITNDVSGQIAVIDRGNCNFTVKVKNAQLAGAIGAIVVNHLGDSIFTMGGTDATITISSVFIGVSDGSALKAGLPASGTIRRTDPAPLMRDGDVDSDIIWHEYGHGLTWRMIGRMSGPLAGAIGEGMSDVLSVLANENDVVAEYAFDDPLGIRSAPYTNYPRTYGDIAGTEVHLDGEVYGAIGWRLFQLFQTAGLSKDLLLDYLVDGMNFTPAQPSFEEMRDGILQAVANRGLGHECLIWQAFAQYGVGVGAKGIARGQQVVVTESFAVAPGCPAP